MAGDKKVEQRGGGVSSLSHLGWGIVNPFRGLQAPCNLHVLKIQACLYTLLVFEHLLFLPKIYSTGIRPNPGSHC